MLDANASPSCASSISATEPTNTGFICPRFSPKIMAGTISTKEPSSTGRYTAQWWSAARPLFFSATGTTTNIAICARMQREDAKIKPRELAVFQHIDQLRRIGLGVGMEVRIRGIRHPDFHHPDRGQREHAGQRKKFPARRSRD